MASLLGLLAIPVAAANVSVQWVEDSYSGFDVIFTGIGFDPLPNGGNGWEATLTSPSGLWQLNTLNYAGYNSYTAPGLPIEVSNFGRMTYLGQLPPSMDPSPSPGDNVMLTISYDDLFPSVTSVQDETPWGVRLFPNFLCSVGWHGYNPIDINSLPVLTDPTTWTWTAEYTATGPSLAIIPEPGSLLIVGWGCLGLIGLRRSFNPDFPDSLQSNGKSRSTPA